MSNDKKRKERNNLTRQTSVPFRNQSALTPDQIRKITDPKSASQQRKDNVSFARIKNQATAERKRPEKAVRRLANSNNPKLLLDTPSTTTRYGVEYPVPSWFQTTKKAEVSVIVPVYKSAKVLDDLIMSWDLDNDGLNVELIFVDDNCPHNSKDTIVQSWLKRKDELKGPVGKIIFSSQNQGFGVTCNTGAQHATGDYVIFLNADTKVTKGWVRPMIRLLKKPDVGLVGNLQLKEGGEWDGTIDGAGSEWCWEDMNFLHVGRNIYKGRKLPRPLHPDNCPKDMLQVEEREMVTGCCVAMRRKDFLEIGGFNPNYRIGYWEDSELSMAVHEKGMKVMFQPSSVIYHKLGHTNTGPHKHHDYNRNYFLNKWVNSGRIDSFVKTSRPGNKPEIKNILLRRQAANGDVLVAAAVAPALKKMYPNAQILFNTKCPNVLEGNPWIDRIIPDEEMSERIFQLYYNMDLCYEYRPFTNILTAYAELCGVKEEDCKLHLATEEWGDLPKEYAVVHAGKTAWVGRDWSLPKFEVVASRIRKTGLPVVCIGTNGDNPVTCDYDIRGKTSMTQLAHVMKNAKFLVGIDSFPMHIAQAVDLPGVCFFGAIEPKSRIISNKMHGVTAPGLACLGCHHRRSTPCTVTNVCETGLLDCINNVTVDQVWNKVQELMKY